MLENTQNLSKLTNKELKALHSASVFPMFPAFGGLFSCLGFCGYILSQDLDAMPQNQLIGSVVGGLAVMLFFMLAVLFSLISRGKKIKATAKEHGLDSKALGKELRQNMNLVGKATKGV